MDSNNKCGKSLIIQFNISSKTTTIDEITNSAINIFLELGYKIKKLYYACDNKVFSSNDRKFYSIFDSIKDRIKGLSIQSDFNQNDFEPNVELDIELNFRYIKSNDTIKYSIILNTDLESQKGYDIYKHIISHMSKHSTLMISGYSYYLDNYYGPISFSNGILRKNNTPIELKKLASFYHSSTVSFTTIGIYNCFSYLDSSKINLLKSIFGENEVITLNSITFFYNRFTEQMSIQDYVKSKKYIEISKTLSSEFNCKMFSI